MKRQFAAITIDEADLAAHTLATAANAEKFDTVSAQLHAVSSALFALCNDTDFIVTDESVVPDVVTPEDRSKRWLTGTQAFMAEDALKKIIQERNDLTFFARDLGFDDHTMIHNAVKPILAEHVARLMVKFRHDIAKVTDPEAQDAVQE